MDEEKYIKFLIPLVFISIVFIGITVSLQERGNQNKPHLTGHEVILPDPQKEGNLSFEETLVSRRSVRDFAENKVTLEEVSQLLWAAQGITDGERKRTAPSAGATYPLEVYIAVKNVEGVEKGVYLYHPQRHILTKVSSGDVSAKLKEAALGQMFIEEASFNIIISAIYKRTTDTYGERGERYVHMEAGHVSQNIYLQCETLGLKTVAVGAFNDKQVASVLNIPRDEELLYIMPVGK